MSLCLSICTKNGDPFQDRRVFFVGWMLAASATHRAARALSTAILGDQEAVVSRLNKVHIKGNIEVIRHTIDDPDRPTAVHSQDDIVSDCRFNNV